MNTTLESILKDLDLHPTSSKIYRELLESGETTARLLSDRLRVTRPSTYDHLAILKKRGLVVERKVDNKTFFAVDDVGHIGHALNEKIDVLTEHEKIFRTMLPSLLKQSKTSTPVVKFFEGEPGLEQILYDVLWSTGETIQTMWPHEEIERVIGQDFLIRFNDKRIREKISVRALWPHSMKPKESYIWKEKDALITRRYAPKGILWSMGYTIYGDKVSFISSHKEIFGFIVESREFSELMRLQFEVMWAQGKEK